MVAAAVADAEAEVANEAEVATAEVAAEVVVAEAPSRDDALRAAVAALQSAVVALQAVSGPETK